MVKEKLLKGLTGNQLKIIAMIAMTCDHIGKQILLDWDFLRITGRLAFPIFAYMIAEGCRYTKNRLKYLAVIACVAFLCQTAYFVTSGSLYQCILVTFTLSIALIYIVDNALKKRDFLSTFFVVLALAAVYLISVVIPNMLTTTDFHIDYGLGGILFPVLVFTVSTKWEKLAVSAVGLILISMSMGGIQWYSLAALPFLALYNGNRGKMQIKYLFYIYYPAHMALIYLISKII